MKITIELTGTLELAALESALEMFEAYADDLAAGHAVEPERETRQRAEAKAVKALLKRIRGSE